MSDNALARRDDDGPRVPRLPSDRPGRTGQATSIEQQRAAAQVYAAVLVAHERPRDNNRAVVQMKDACQRKELAERAFYSYRRAGESITGPTVQLARELARCWGNVEYGLVELSRDDAQGESEMLAFAWDLETNTRSSHTFIVKHLRDTKQGTKKLTEQRDVYENNANNGARRVREAVFAVLPGWFTEQATETCHATIQHGGGVPLQRRIASAIDGYAALPRPVTKQQLEQHVGYDANQWTAHDVARLGVTFRSIERGETSVDEVFPRPENRVTTDELRAQQPGGAKQPAPPKGGKAEQQPLDADEAVDRSDEQRELEEQEAAGGGQPS